MSIRELNAYCTLPHTRRIALYRRTVAPQARCRPLTCRTWTHEPVDTRLLRQIRIKDVLCIWLLKARCRNGDNEGTYTTYCMADRPFLFLVDVWVSL